MFTFKRVLNFTYKPVCSKLKRSLHIKHKAFNFFHLKTFFVAQLFLREAKTINNLIGFGDNVGCIYEVKKGDKIKKVTRKIYEDPQKDFFFAYPILLLFVEMLNRTKNLETKSTKKV